METEGVALGAGLRVHDARGAWVSLVNAIEKAGIPLVDTKDATLRSRLIAAGYTQRLCAAGLFAGPTDAGHRPAAGAVRLHVGDRQLAVAHQAYI